MAHTFTGPWRARISGLGALLASPVITTMTEEITLNVEAARSVLARVGTARVDVNLKRAHNDPRNIVNKLHVHVL
jgi:hypothetical protein